MDLKHILVAFTGGTVITALIFYAIVRSSSPEPVSTPKAPAAAVAAVAAVTSIEPVSDEDRRAAAGHVQRISESKATVAEVFRGPSGFLGVVIATGPNKFIGWMPSTRDVLLVGALFDQTGRNLTQAEMSARGYASDATAQPQPQTLPPQQAIQQAVDKTIGFTEGSGGPVVTAFIDFNCGFCREFYHRSRALVSQGAMRIRWVPVAILQQDSMAKASAVMTSRNPVEALAHIEENKLALPGSVRRDVEESVNANNAVLNMLTAGNSATPTLVVRRADGNFEVSPGLPRDLNDFISKAGR